MSLNDYAHRVKRLVNRETAILNKETKIAKQCDQYYESLYQLIATLQNRCERVREEEATVAYLKESNEKIRKEILEMKAEAMEDEKREAELMKELESVMHEKLKFYTLKNLTNIHINFNALPQRVQGAFVTESDNVLRLEPFCYETSGHSFDDIQAMLWQQIALSSPYTANWQSLFLEALRESDTPNVLQEFEQRHVHMNS